MYGSIFNRCIPAALLVALLSLPAAAQWIEKPMTGTPQEMLADRTTLVGQSGLGPYLQAELAAVAENRKQRRAAVMVHCDGVQLVAPDPSRTPKLDEAHFRYQLDQQPPLHTTARVMEFSNLSPGRHTIRVALAGNNNEEIGEEIALTVHIP